MYSIKAIATLTGLSTETLRAWERRYQVVTPRRDASGRRAYSEQDLERLMLLADLTRHGHSIGKISRMDNRQLDSLIRQDKKGANSGHEQFIARVIEALLQYRVDRCEELLKRALLAYEPVDYVRNILQPTLQTVGQLWHEKKLSIAQEHMFSACVKRIILSMINNIHQLTDDRPSMMFATPQGETHEFGILMASLLAASQQYNCYYLGGDLPVEDIIEASRHLKPNIIVLSVVNAPPAESVCGELAKLSHAARKTKTDVWIGGNGALYLSERHQLAQPIQLLADIDQFYRKAWKMKAFVDKTAVKRY